MEKQEQYIGTAVMDDDRIITLKLHAKTPGGDYGHSVFYVRPSDRNYAETIEHLGGIEPGQKKPVRPWS
jgi:hypothetical protein